MSEKLTSPFKTAPPSEYLFFAAIFLYTCVHGYVNYLYYPNEWAIGYNDYAYWGRPLDDLLQGKTFFKDFNYYYGPLFVFFQLPFYYYFGSNHWALLINIHLIMPLLSLVLAYLTIRIFIKVSWLRIIFLLVCILHFNVGQYPSPRAICAGLTLALFYYCLIQPEKKILGFLTGVMQGFSILMGTEYGVALFITIAGYFILFTGFSDNGSQKKLIPYLLSGLLVSLAPFALYLIYHGVLFGFLIDYYLQVTTFVGQDQPGRSDFFPPFPKISSSDFFHSTGQAIISHAFVQYLPIIVYCFGGVVFIVKFFRNPDPDCFKYFLLTVFGSLIFYRGWTHPPYTVYGLGPAITLGFLFIEYLWLHGASHSKNYNHKTGYKLVHLAGSSFCSTLLIFIFVWFSLTIRNKPFFTFNPGKPKSEDMIYYDKAGFEVSKEAYDQYKMINNYIEQNVSADEYILSYPWGPYSQFTGRTNAITFSDVAYGVVTERQRNIALNQLEKNKPKFIILNHVNAGVLVGPFRGDTPNQTSWLTEDSPVFAGYTNPLQIYVLENYHLDKKFKYATIFKRNETRKPFDRTFEITPIDSQIIKEVISQKAEPVDNNFKFKVRGRKLRIEYILQEPQYATHIELKFLINQAFGKKLLTKSHLRLGIKDSQNQKVLGGPNTNDIGDMGRIKTKWEGTYVPDKMFLKKITSIWIELETPEPYVLPQELDIISLKFLYDERIKLD